MARRLARLEATLGDVDDHPRLLIVIEGDDGAWWWNGAEIDKTTVDPRTQVVVITEREDGPQ